MNLPRVDEEQNGGQHEADDERQRDDANQNEPLKLQAPTMNLQQHGPGSQHTPTTNPIKITSATDP